MRQPASTRALPHGAISIVLALSAAVATAGCAEPPPDPPVDIDDAGAVEPPDVQCAQGGEILVLTVHDTLMVSVRVDGGGACQMVLQDPSGALTADLTVSVEPVAGCTTLRLTDVQGPGRLTVLCTDATAVTTRLEQDVFVRARPGMVDVRLLESGDVEAFWNVERPDLGGCTLLPSGEPVDADAPTGRTTATLLTWATDFGVRCAAEGVPGGDANPLVSLATVLNGSPPEGEPAHSLADVALIVGELNLAELPRSNTFDFPRLREAGGIYATPVNGFLATRFSAPLLKALDTLMWDQPGGGFDAPQLEEIRVSMFASDPIALPGLERAAALRVHLDNFNDAELISMPALTEVETLDIWAPVNLRVVDLASLERGAVNISSDALTDVYLPDGARIDLKIESCNGMTSFVPQHDSLRTLVLNLSNTIATVDTSAFELDAIKVDVIPLETLKVNTKSLTLSGGRLRAWSGSLTVGKFYSTSLGSLDLALGAGAVVELTVNSQLQELTLRAQDSVQRLSLEEVDLGQISGDLRGLHEVSIRWASGETLVLSGRFGSVDELTIAQSWPTSIDLPSDLAVGALAIDANPDLTDLTAAAGFAVTGALTVTNNPALSCAAINAFLCSLPAPPATLSVADNAEASCPPATDSCAQQ